MTTKKLLNKDVQAVMKLINFNPNSDHFKFITAIHDIGDERYYLLRTIEILKQQSVDEQDLIQAARLLVLALHERKSNGPNEVKPKKGSRS